MSETFPGYPSLIGPESLAIPDRLIVTTPEEYALWQLIIVSAKKGANGERGKVWDTQRRLNAYVNQGRWVVDCAWCKVGILTRPDWGTAHCIQCGARYAKGLITFPDDPNIERLLKLRPVIDTQNWDNKQTAADLLRENTEELHLDNVA